MLSFFSNMCWKSLGIGAVTGAIVAYGAQKLYAAGVARQAAAKAKAAEEPAKEV